MFASSTRRRASRSGDEYGELMTAETELPVRRSVSPRPDDEDAKEDAGAAAGAAATGAAAAGAAAAGAAGAGAADTKKQKTAAAAEAAGISPKVNYGTDEQQQAYEDARIYDKMYETNLDSFKIRAGKLLERFEQVFPHVENLRAHAEGICGYPSDKVRQKNLDESESLDKSFEVLRKFFRHGKDDTAHCAASFYAQETAKLEYVRIVILNGEEPWEPAVQEMHRSRIQAAKERAAKWEAANMGGK